MSDLYKRQKNPNPTHEYDVVVVGCGGVGYYTAKFMAMSGMCRSLYLVDGDHLEESNLNRLPYSQDQLGEQKVDVLQQELNRIRPELPVVSIDQYFEKTDNGWSVDFDVPVDCVLFCADNAEAREDVANYFNTLHSQDKVLFTGAEADEVTITTTESSITFMEGSGYDDIWAGNSARAGVDAVMAFRERMVDNELVPERETWEIDPYKCADLKRKVAMKQQQIDELHDELSDMEQLEHENEQLTEYKQKYEKARQTIGDLLNEMRDLVEENQRLKREGDTGESVITA